MPLKRFSDWPLRLDAYVLSTRERSFAWGTFDCALNVCDAVLAISGTDIGAGFRGKYSTFEQAQDVIKAYAGGGILELAEKIAADFEIPACPATFARRGDVVFVDGGEIPAALGFVGLDGRHALCASEAGVARVHMSGWRRGWQIG